MAVIAAGRYLLVGRNDGETRPALRVVEAKTGEEVANLWPRGIVNRIRPLADGTALITALETSPRRAVGLRFDPATLALTQLWSLPISDNCEDSMGFDPGRGVGVVTNWHLVTRLMDLKTGAGWVVVDNSENYREE